MAPPGGRGRGQGQNPPAPAPGDLERRQVAASNSTLNAWVGRRQPSWLANASPVLPTPRPARPPPTPTPTPAPASAPVQAPIPATSSTNMASSESQPQPHTLAQFQPRQPLPQPPRQSPYPSQLGLQPGSQSPSEPSHQPVPRLPSAPSLPAPLQQPQTVTASGPPQLFTSLAGPVLASPAPTDEPSPCLSLPHDGSDARNIRSISTPKDPTANDAHFVVESHVSSHSPQSRDPASPVDNGQCAPSQGTIQLQPHPASSSMADMALNTAPSLTTGDVNNGGTISWDTSWYTGPKRRRIERNAAVVFLDSLRAQTKIETCLREAGGEQYLDENVEIPRFQLLSKACREGDIFFVVLHQLFCSWTVSQASVHGLCHEVVHDTAMVDNAFGIMGQLLKANSKLGWLRLRWFANFPEELPRLRLHQSYAQTIHQVLDFLIRVSQNWSIINHKHLSLGYPLLMKELVLIFRLHSPILQLIMFRASRRTLGVPDHPIGNQLDDLFKEDQEKHRNSNDGTYTLQLEGEAYDNHNNSLIQKYQALITRYQRIRPSHSPSIPAASSAAQSPGASSPSPVGSHAQAEMTQRFRPTPLPISTGRVVPSNPNAHSPSPTYSPINALHPTISPDTSAALSPQYAAAVPHVLTSSPAVGMATSSYQSTYQSPGVPQQGQYGTPNGHAQQSALQWRHGPLVPLQQQQLPQHLRQQLEQQQYYGFMLYQQQQQAQQQQQQQHRQHQAQFQQYQQQQQPQQYIHRKRSQPGAVPSSRPSPVQATRPSPSLSNPASQPSPHFQSPNSQLVSATPLRNLAPSVSAVAHQPGLVDSLSSPGAVNTVQPSNIHPRGSQRQPTQTTDRLIPPPNFRINLQDYPHTPYDKRSIESSLHQAHLRSPKRILKLPSATNSSERYYQAIKNFALEPRPLSPRLYMHQFTFSVASVCLEKLSLNEKIEGEAQIVNRFSDGSLRIRVRCCNPPTATGPIPDHIWVICETTWPDHIFMTLNGHRLETQRKQHHSKDLPVEISSLVCAGVNTLSVSVLMPSPPRKPKPGTSYVAVEIVETLSHSAILQMVHTSGSRPASETREVIQRRLAGSRSNAAGDDHDLEMPSDGISIDLADPFTATMFKIPARGKACTHLECFDLETWLNTRLGKRSSCTCSRENCKCPKEPSLVDKWKCPVCDGDARPYSLCIDQFLLEVRTRLQQDNQLRTKSITVFADGSWRVNDSPNDEESDSESDDNRTRATSKTTSKPSVPRTIIELDDD